MGRETKKIDAKGRFILSSKLCESMGKELVVTNSLDSGYLCIYTPESYEKIKNQIKRFDGFRKQVRILERAIISEHQDVTVDSQGRVSISSELWERIDAVPGCEICLFPLDDRIDICTKDHYDKEEHDLSAIEGLESLYSAAGL